MLPLAHAGHWLVYVIYAAPVLIVLASIVATVARERRTRDFGRRPARRLRLR